MTQTPNYDLNMFDSNDDMEQNSRLGLNDNADKIDTALKGLQDDIDGLDAADVPYDNTVSGLTATDVQAALDEELGKIDILYNEIDITSEFNLGTSGLSGAVRMYYTPALCKVHGVVALQASSTVNTTTPYLTVSQTYRPQEVKTFPILVRANDDTWLPYYMQIDINGQITQKLTATSKGIYGYFEYNI